MLPKNFPKVINIWVNNTETSTQHAVSVQSEYFQAAVCVWSVLYSHSGPSGRARRAMQVKATNRHELEQYWSGSNISPDVSDQCSVSCLHTFCNLLPSCGLSRLMSLEARLTTRRCIYHFCHMLWHYHVPLTKAGVCQYEGGAAFFGCFPFRLILRSLMGDYL